MTTRMSSVWTWGVLLAILGRVDAADALTATARQILDAAGVKGGLIVHLGCGDGKLTAALRASDSFLVHGLDPDAKNVETARAHIRSLGLYGKVSVDQLRGNHLPYADNLVNLLVCEYARERVSESEMTRVLAPGGVALSVNPKSKIPNPKSVKPRPEGVDEWTHFLHDASGNPVAHDRVVGPPRHLQWTSDPPYTRSHEHTPSVAAVVSTDGRLFYIADEAPVSSMLRSAQWHLVARDAYNGVLLWKRPIAQWWPHICGWTQGPRQLQRKLVAVGKRVYVTLGFHAPLSALDAATGETLRVYDQTHGTEEVVWHKGTLLLVVRSVTPERVAELDKWVQLSKEKKSPLHSRETIEPLLKQFRGIEGKAEMAVLALEADTGRMLWKKAGADVDGLRPVSLRAIGDRVLLQKAQNVVSLDLKTGKEQWTAACAAPLRVVGDRAVVCADGKTVAAFSTETGEALWTQKPLLSDVRDAFLIRGSLWLGGFKPYSTGRQKHTGPAWGPYFVTQHDLATGAVLKEINPENPSHHHRCYANKATDRYIVGGRRGTEFIDIQTGEVFWHSWARGVCQYGVMPCNGLLYCPPHACGCYVTTKLSGFNALAGQRSEVRGQTSETGRLERGPAFSGISKLKSQISETGDWATYRHDAARSGATRSAVPVKLKAAWQTALSGNLTPPTVAGGKVFVASVDEHRVCALDADSGKAGWDFTAGGRVDSPPTVFGEQALFGCRDGH
ncbi:MAG: methyltransferase domain-containing protein, partial [Planctomycetes bacterium]|nr:methyltransferase domain-containing protein [Planctomycetota bacterium]